MKKRPFRGTIDGSAFTTTVTFSTVVVVVVVVVASVVATLALLLAASLEIVAVFSVDLLDPSCAGAAASAFGGVVVEDPSSSIDAPAALSLSFTRRFIASILRHKKKTNTPKTTIGIFFCQKKYRLIIESRCQFRSRHR